MVEELRARDAGDIVVFGGGIIPDADIPVLEAAGIDKVFGPGTSLETIQEWVDDRFAPVS